MSVSKYQDLIIWKTSFELTRSVYQISDEGDFARDFGLRDQMRRAAISTMANIAEGFASARDRQFIRFLNIARSSAMEVQSLLHLAWSLKYVSKAEFEKLYDCFDHLRAGTTALIRHLRSKTEATPQVG